MIRPPPISTLFPYTTLFRSHYKSYHRKVRLKPYCSGLRLPIKPAITKKQNGCSIPSAAPKPMRQTFNSERSEERRVGKECRSRWSESHEKKKKQETRG